MNKPTLFQFFLFVQSLSRLKHGNAIESNDKIDLTCDDLTNSNVKNVEVIEKYGRKTTKSTIESKTAESIIHTNHSKIWNIDDIHKCNIERINIHELKHRFPPMGLFPRLYKEPIIIVDDRYNRNSKFQNMSSIEGILQWFSKSFPITLSSSNSFSHHRHMTTLGEYINETIHSETFSFHRSNESWYFFGETYSNEWKDYLLEYDLPPCETCDRSLSALAFGIGNKGSGVQWHVHGPGFSESLHGRKHWLLYPPSNRPHFNANFTTRHWMEHIYPNLNDLPWECTVHPGEMIYFPNQWYHAILNLDTYTSFVSTFTTEH